MVWLAAYDVILVLIGFVFDHGIWYYLILFEVIGLFNIIRHIYIDIYIIWIRLVYGVIRYY